MCIQYCLLTVICMKVYNRYWNDHLRSTLTVCWQGKPDLDLETKLQCFMRPKCHPIFFDSNINSADVVRLNIYQVFLLCAMKFHCYVSELSYVWKLNTSSYLKIIEKSLRYRCYSPLLSCRSILIKLELLVICNPLPSEPSSMLVKNKTC